MRSLPGPSTPRCRRSGSPSTEAAHSKLQRWAEKQWRPADVRPISRDVIGGGDADLAEGFTRPSRWTGRLSVAGWQPARPGSFGMQGAFWYSPLGDLRRPAFVAPPAASTGPTLSSATASSTCPTAREIASATVGARIACLSSFYRFGIRMGLVIANPCDALERPRTVATVPFDVVSWGRAPSPQTYASNSAYGILHACPNGTRYRATPPARSASRRRPSRASPP
jgi:hypothetical protein